MNPENEAKDVDTSSLIQRAEVYDLIDRFLAQELPRYPPDKDSQRARKEIEFNLIYAHCFSHGTDGHNLRLICADQAGRLDEWLQRSNAK